MRQMALLLTLGTMLAGACVCRADEMPVAVDDASVPATCTGACAGCKDKADHCQHFKHFIRWLCYCPHKCKCKKQCCVGCCTPPGYAFFLCYDNDGQGAGCNSCCGNGSCGKHSCGKGSCGQDGACAGCEKSKWWKLGL